MNRLQPKNEPRSAKKWIGISQNEPGLVKKWTGPAKNEPGSAKKINRAQPKWNRFREKWTKVIVINVGRKEQKSNIKTVGRFCLFKKMRWFLKVY
jgi:hypothetical protein